MVYSGVIVIRKEFEGSKSEGNYVYLNTGETEYRLFRMDVFPVNDVFFSPFEGKKVEIEGTVTDYCLSVEKISEVQESKTDSQNEINTELEEKKNEKEM